MSSPLGLHVNYAIILPLWKGKGSKSDCTKYRGISLLSVPAKVFAHIMSRTYEENDLCEAATATERLYPWSIHTESLPSDSQLSDDMSTANHYMQLTSTSELSLTLWTATHFGTFLKLLEYHQNWLTSSKLYASTHSVVRVNGTISEAFSISSGVRQGCVLAANLFNSARDRILNITTQALTLGVNYDDSGQFITDLDYIMQMISSSSQIYSTL